MVLTFTVHTVRPPAMLLRAVLAAAALLQEERMSCQLGCCHCDRDLIMHYFIPATISSCRGEVEKPPKPSCCAVLNYSIHTVLRNHSSKNVFEIIIGNWDFTTSTGAPFISIRLRAHR
jgi:hypothetical protein